MEDSSTSVETAHVRRSDKYNYDFATSPDIIRTYEKDAYISSYLAQQASNIIRSLLGARTAHKYTNATSHLSELLYLSSTTLVGNRTLGEEYCDVIQIEDDNLQLAGLLRRVGYIINVVFAPWILSKILPALRRKLRVKLERNIQRARIKAQHNKTRAIRVQEYLLKNLDTITSLSPIYALSLAAFYFTGSYYHLSKRLFGLRYIFTKQIEPSERREGYEVLGVLLLLQMTVQSLLHVRETYLEALAGSDALRITDSDNQPEQVTTALVGPRIEVPITSDFSSGGDHLLADVHAIHHLPKGLSNDTQTPILEGPRYDGSNEETMAWIPQGQQRKCTLCLEPFKDPSATTCGHVFCWTCVQDWVKEKAECPLCRQTVLPQKILPLR